MNSDHYEPEWTRSGNRLLTWVVWVLLAVFFAALLVFLTGCKTSPTASRPTGVVIEDVARAVGRADAKLAEAEPLIASERPKLLVHEARKDLGEATAGAAIAEKSAQADAAAIAKQKLEIQRLRERDVVRSALYWAAGITALAAAGLGVAWWLLRAPSLGQLSLISLALSGLCVGLAWWLPAIRIIVGLAIAAGIIVGAYLAARWLWTYLAAANVIRSIDKAREQGAITFADRAVVAAVIDPIQGRSGKALVDHVQRTRK